MDTALNRSCEGRLGPRRAVGGPAGKHKAFTVLSLTAACMADRSRSESVTAADILIGAPLALLLVLIALALFLLAA